jgi:alkylation response protein AidB-like acyl-CoA dehydrogenase
VLDGLRELGAFGMKIPKEYGGLGFTNAEYNRVMTLLGSVDGSLGALLSAHQSIGVPQPLKLFGTEAQKKKYLPRCAAGEISAFALTENHVGSDPARLATTAEKTPDGSAYVLNGTKLWCTNGTLARLLVVMAVHPGTRKISAFVVETDWKGVSVDHRCRFMGLRALANAVMTFKDVRVPAENLIGGEGRGLKIALTTLNDGRLSIPNSSVGTAKACLEIVRQWGNERVQWGKPVGRHEAIAHLIADMAARTFAMESVANLATEMSDRGGYDIRLEAAAAKEWNTFRAWEIVDDTMQIRGGRGYETEVSLRERGEAAVGVERMMRDYRINKIFEGSTEIMHLFMAREMVDRHLQVAGALIDPDKGWREKLGALPGMAAFYAWWYPTRFVGFSFWPRHGAFGTLGSHLRFVERSSRRLARQSFHGMLVYQGRLQNKQAFLFRLVDIANELFAMTASICRAQALSAAGRPEGTGAVSLCDQFCRGARRRVQQLFRDLWSNDDARRYRGALDVLAGRYAWLEEGIQGLAASSPEDPAVGQGSRETVAATR